MSANKKKLPKAIVQTAHTMREAGAAEQRQDGVPSASVSEPAAASAPARNSAAADNVIDIALNREAPGVLVANDMSPAIAMPDGAFEMRHRSMARAIVERHANFSAIGGIIPLPIINVASVAAIILRMLKMLSRHYGVPFERERARMIVIGLTGGCMPTGLAAVTASTLSFIVPGSNLFGLAVCSVTASTCTRGIGKMFIELFESGATWRDIPAIEKR
jgi:uncharacterized protein (DUF697 family)